jgi:hypothetical protein
MKNKIHIDHKANDGLGRDYFRLRRRIQSASVSNAEGVNSNVNLSGKRTFAGRISGEFPRFWDTQGATDHFNRHLCDPTTLR